MLRCLSFDGLLQCRVFLKLLIKLVFKSIIFMEQTGKLTLLCFIGSLRLIEI
jgi:hypothetical protein